MFFHLEMKNHCSCLETVLEPNPHSPQSYLATEKPVSYFFRHCWGDLLTLEKLIRCEVMEVLICTFKATLFAPRFRAFLKCTHSTPRIFYPRSVDIAPLKRAWLGPFVGNLRASVAPRLEDNMSTYRGRFLLLVI